jgi:multiple sugar transport system substrate-binding protein
MNRIQRLRTRNATRRQMIQVGAALAAAGFALPAGAARAQTPAVSDVSGTLRAMSWETESEMRKWFRHTDEFFSTRYPNMTPEIEYGIEWDAYWTKLQTALAGGAQVDMCWMHDSRAQSYASLGLVQPLDDLIAADPPQGWPDDYYATQVGAFQYDGVQYAIPYDWATRGLYVNLDVLDRAGVETPTVDWTLEDLLEAGLKIKASAPNPDDAWGFFMGVTAGNTEWVVKSFGGEQFTADPLTAHFDDPNTIAAFQFLYDAINTHKVMPNPAGLQGLGLDVHTAFASGLLGIAAMLNDEAFVYADIVGDKAKWTVAPTPRGKDGRYQFVGGSGFSIPITAAFPEVAYEYITFMATDPANLPITAEMGSMFVSQMDAWQDAMPDASQVDPEVYKYVFYDLGREDGTVPLYFPGYQQWETTVYNRHMERLWTGATSDVTAICQQVQEETVALLASMEG